MSLKRRLADWVTSYLEFTDDTEPPISYHIWTALTCISAALQRRVWVEFGHEIIYPNLYIVLVGPAGRCRKGTAMKIGKTILADIQGIEIVAQSITRERLIQVMHNKMASFERTVGGKLDTRWQAPVCCFSEELSVFLEQKDIKFLANMTDWYDSGDKWAYETKTQGRETINGVCVSLLGATAPDWMASMFPQEAIGGGFTSRVIFVVEEKKRKTVAQEVYTDKHRRLRDDLVNDLGIIANITGPYKRTPEMIEAYNAWYEQQDDRLDKGDMPVPDPRFAAYCDRRATHVRKLSMVFAASRHNGLTIELEDFRRAVESLEAVEMRMHKAFGGLGRSDYSEAVEMVLDYLLVHHKALRSEILKRFWRDIDPPTLKVVEETLESMKAIRIKRDLGANEVTYELLT